MAAQITLTVVNRAGTHRSTHASVSRALAAYLAIEPDGLDIREAHYIASSAGHYLGVSACGSVVTLASNLH